MSEADLETWDRELAEWRRKFAAWPVPRVLEQELEAAVSELAMVRARVRQRIFITGDRVVRHLERIRGLWQYVAGYDDDSRTTPA
jgi:hypothetical protein